MDARELGFQSAMIKNAISREMAGRAHNARGKAHDAAIDSYLAIRKAHKEMSKNKNNPLTDEGHANFNRAADEAKGKITAARNKAIRMSDRYVSWEKGKASRLSAHRSRIMKRRMVAGGVGAATLLGAGLLAHHAIKKRRERMKKAAGLYSGTLPNMKQRKAMAASGAGGAALGVAGTLAVIALLKRRQHALGKPAQPRA